MGHVIRTVKYAGGLVLLGKGEAVLQDVINRQNEIGRYYGKEVNVDITNVLRISKQPSPIQIMIDQNNWRMWRIATILVAR